MDQKTYCLNSFCTKLYANEEHFGIKLSEKHDDTFILKYFMQIQTSKKKKRISNWNLYIFP